MHLDIMIRNFKPTAMAWTLNLIPIHGVELSIDPTVETFQAGIRLMRTACKCRKPLVGMNRATTSAFSNRHTERYA